VLGDQEVAHPFEPKHIVEGIIKIYEVPGGDDLPIISFLMVSRGLRRVEIRPDAADPADHDLPRARLNGDGLHTGRMTGNMDYLDPGKYLAVAFHQFETKIPQKSGIV